MPLAYVGTNRFIIPKTDTLSHIFNHTSHLKKNVPNLTRESPLPDPQLSDILSLIGCLLLFIPKYFEHYTFHYLETVTHFTVLILDVY